MTEVGREPAIDIEATVSGEGTASNLLFSSNDSILDYCCLITNNYYMTIDSLEKFEMVSLSEKMLTQVVSRMGSFL